MDAAAREAQSGLEWRVTVPEGASVTMEHEAGGPAARACAWLLACLAKAWSGVAGFARKVWRIAADDPRKAVHGLKVALALALVSVFYYTRPLYDGVGGAAMWAIMTVVVVFEYTVGESIGFALAESVHADELPYICVDIVLTWSLHGQVAACTSVSTEALPRRAPAFSRSACTGWRTDPASSSRSSSLAPSFCWVRTYFAFVIALCDSNLLTDNDRPAPLARSV